MGADWVDSAELFATLVLRQIRPHAAPAFTPAKAAVQLPDADPPSPSAGILCAQVFPDGQKPDARPSAFETLLTDLACRRIRQFAAMEGVAHDPEDP